MFLRMSGNFQQIRSRYTPEDRTLQINKTMGHILQCLVLIMQQIFQYQLLRYVHYMEVQFYKFHISNWLPEAH
jgi:hypothetical protein